MGGRTTTGVPPLSRLAAALVLVLLVGTSGRAGATPQRLMDILARIEPARIAEDVAALAALGRRIATDPGFPRATALVAQRMRDAGVQVTLDTFDIGPALVSNVVGTIGDESSGRPVLLVTAHYDSITFPTSGAAPGAEDNASGTAALLAIARALSGEPLATQVKLVAYAAEEQGLWGSRHLVQQLSGPDEIDLALNMDMVGYRPAGRPAELLLDSSPLGRTLLAQLAYNVRRVVDVQLTAGIFAQGRTDHLPLLEAGIPAVTLASAWHDRYPYYHSAQDLPAHVDPLLVATAARAVAAHVVLSTGFRDGPPVARAGALVETRPGQTVRLDGTRSFDPQGQPLSHRWRQLDGPPAQPEQHGAEARFVAREPGIYRFLLTVQSPDGRLSEPSLAAAVVQQRQEGCALGAPGGAAPTGVGATPAGVALLLLSGLVWLRRLRRRA